VNVHDIVQVLDEIAPPALAAEWDNVGLLTGDRLAEVRKIILCVDLTAAVLAEARRGNCQMILAYHPVIFRPVSRLSRQDNSLLYDIMRMGVAVYSPHTALDAAAGGTNDCLADVLNLRDRRPLQPVQVGLLQKVVVFAPPEDLPGIARVAFRAGAGQIGNYSECSFFTHGIGTFSCGENTNPTVGMPGSSEAVEEVRLEMVVPREQSAGVVHAIRLAHSYEEPVVDLYPLENSYESLGLGRIGLLPKPAKLSTIVARVKKALTVPKVLLAGSFSAGAEATIKTVAVAAGSCGELWRHASQAGADLYITGEMRHHEALAAASAGLPAMCVGHSNSERITLTRIASQLRAKLSKLKITLAKSDHDPMTIV
jgi:dinuclear metal center YbgI/SA1388 family protein